MILLIFSSEVGKSALLATIIIGFAIFKMFLVNSIKSFSSHLLKSGLIFLLASIMSSIAIPVPDNWSNNTFAISKCSAPTLRTNLTQFLDNIPYIHITISSSKNSMSSNGSWLPISTGWPSISVDPDASIT